VIRAGRVACTTERRNAHRVLVWKSEGMNHVQNLRGQRGNILNGRYINSIRICGLDSSGSGE
jgi:hypothetical protein